jgi:type VI secretion system protein ImpL
VKKVLSFLVHPLTLAIVGLLAFALVVLFVGPLVSIGTWRPLATLEAQLTLIGLVVAIFVIVKAIGWWRSRARNRSVVAQLAGGEAGAESAEVGQLRSRFEAALAALRDSRLSGRAGPWPWATWLHGKRYLYELPWFAIVGAPGSGKTTALLNSGLRFPLADRMGVGSVKGVGGTRNCDWWFAEQAVLLDTAGRYTTHDSDRESDRRAWEGFLGLLKRTRPRRPLNGVLVTASVADLLTFSGPQRTEHAATLRKRVDELQQSLGLRLPIYLLVTKCDLLAGFMDYFADSDQLERNQPWGFTFEPEDSTKNSATGHFGAEFDGLTQRLLNGVIDRVQAERDRGRRARIYGFPLQFGGLRSALGEIVEAVGSASSYGTAPLLRGVYFISGTQEGTPFDRLLGALARELRLDRALLPPNRATGRSFFIHQVLSDIVFAESELAGTNLAWERKRQAIAWGSYALIGIATVFLLVAWTISYMNNRGEVRAFAGRVAALKTLVDATPNRASGELLPIEPALTAAANLTVADASVPWFEAFGLYQGDKLRAAAGLVYRRMLGDGLLPRIALRVEELMRSAGQNTQLLYETLKSYVMLHSPEHYDPQALRRFVSADWDANLAGLLTPEQRTSLDRHLQALFELPVASSPLAEDRELVAHVREQLASQPLAQRIYTRLKWLGVGADIPEFTVQRAAGVQAPSIFVRQGGLPLNRGVAGLYSYDGYHKAFKQSIAPATRELSSEEGWVLATGGRTLAQPLDDLQVIEQVRRAYLNEYIQIWESFIATIRLKPTDSPDEVRQAAKILSAKPPDDNPLANLLRAMVHETTLTVPIENQSLLERAEAGAAGALEKSRQGLNKLFGGASNAPTPPAAQPERIVDDRFASLRAMVKSGDGGVPAKLDTTINLLGDVYNVLNAAKVAKDAGERPPDATKLFVQVQQEGARLAEPLRQLLEMLSAAAQVAMSSQSGELIASNLNAEVIEPCRDAISDRYPFNRSSDREVRPDDFAKFFAPNGKFDDFFQKNLAQLVDTSTRPWSPRQHGAGKIQVSAGTMQQFERAQAIRDAFFPRGGQMSLRLEFVPYDMDPTITKFTLDVDGQLVEWAFGPKIPKTVVWPGPRGSNQVRLTLLPTGPGGSGMVIDGPWALFRMFDKMQVNRLNSSERFRVTFSVEGRKATFDVTAASVQNPFAMREMREFHCPAGL